MLPVPKAVGKELNTAVVDFVWDGKARLVENCTIVNRVATGGLNLPHMESNINAFRLKMLIVLYGLQQFLDNSFPEFSRELSVEWSGLREQLKVNLRTP